MRRCVGCGQRTDLHGACTVHRVVIGGGTFERRRYDALAASRCVGCGAMSGGYHHVGCVREVCAVCGKLLGACRCSRLAAQASAARYADGRVVEPAWELGFGRE